MPIWQLILVARDYGLDAEKTAAHFRFPLHRVKAAFHYYEAYPQEIDQAIADNEAMTFDKLKRLLPQLEAIPVPQSVLDGERAMSFQFQSYIVTQLDPHQVILRLSEELKLSEPITTHPFKESSIERNAYQCEVPFALEGLPPEIKFGIIVEVWPVDARVQKDVDEIFDALGIAEQRHTSVEVLLLQPDYFLPPDDNFSLTDSQRDDFYEEGYLQVLRTMGALLRCVDGDCFLHRENNGYCQLIRKKGEVIFDPTIVTWEAKESQAVGLPLTISRIPYLPFY